MADSSLHVPAATILDSRRLTGPSLMLDRAGAILEASLDGVAADAFAAEWARALGRMLDAVGWPRAATAWRAWPGGAAFAFEAPFDALYAATEVNEWAFAAAREATGAGEPAADFAAEAGRLRAAIAAEAKPAWPLLRDACARRGVTFLWDDERGSVGLGDGSLTWPAAALPESAAQVPWAAVHDVPTVLVTGTNGKTTTVRLLAAIAAAAGRVAGATSTDQVTIGTEVVAEGDYSGPNGARTVLRDRRVQVGVLEVARGGILRRGLPLPHASAAVVTNVASDHLGEFGIFDVEALADAKLVVAKAVGLEGRVVLNADDPRVLVRGARLGANVLWFTLDPDHMEVRAHLDRGRDAALLEDGALVLYAHGARQVVARAADVPVTFGGSARHNVANALAAIGAASALGLPVEAMRTALTTFASDPATNPGRANVWRFGATTAIVDFAHNPHGLEALAAMAAALPATRRALVIGQAGDRDDEAIRAFARAAWALRPDRVFVKEMEIYLRGRSLGVVPAMIDAELRACGAAAEQLEHHGSELAAVRAALAWAREGDLLLLTTHAQRDEVLALMASLASRGWRAGDAAGG